MAERVRLNRKSKSKSNGKANSRGLGGVPDEVYQRWMKRIELAQTAVDRAQKPLKSKKGELSAIYKAAKADGVNVDAVKTAFKKHKLDHLQVAMDYRDTGRVLRLMESPLAVQMSLFGNQLPDLVNVALEGKLAGELGVDVNQCPYKPGTEEFVAYHDAWGKGQAELRDTLHD